MINKTQTLAYQQATYLRTPQELAHFCDYILQTQEWIAIDTEFVRVDTYYPELSLVQIADSDLTLTIIDPLAIMDSTDAQTNRETLQPLIELLCSTKVCKVFHSARQDLEVLYQLAQKMPQNIFDTQIAAIFFKHGDLAGYARVVEQELGTVLPKSQTRTNWHQRPLSEQQISYALDDVYFLAQLFIKYQSTLSEQQKQAVFEDCQQLLNADIYETKPENAWLKVKGIQPLKPKQLAVVKSLAHWRETFAQVENLPKKWTLSDEVIVHLAKRPPKTVQAIYKVPNIKSSSVHSFGETWVQLIDDVFTRPKETYPEAFQKPTPTTPQEEILVQVLLNLAQQVAINYKLNITNLTNKSELTLLIHQDSNPSLAENSAEFRSMQNFGWRKQLFFNLAEKLLAGELTLRCKDGQLSW